MVAVAVRLRPQPHPRIRPRLLLLLQGPKGLAVEILETPETPAPRLSRMVQGILLLQIPKIHGIHGLILLLHLRPIQANRRPKRPPSPQVKHSFPTSLGTCLTTVTVDANGSTVVVVTTASPTGSSGATWVASSLSHQLADDQIYSGMRAQMIVSLLRMPLRKGLEASKSLPSSRRKHVFQLFQTALSQPRSK